MIHEALSLIRKELVAYLKGNAGYNMAEDIVIIENIGLFESTSSGVNFDDRIVLTLANIEEESTLKNVSVVKRGSGSKASYETAPTYLNLYLLISSCNKTEGAGNKNYLDALEKLSHVIRFFQGKKRFSLSDSSFYDAAKFAETDALALTVTADLYTLSFEQINHLWGTLGGKQMPSVMYKLRLVEITDRKQLREVPLIEEIQNNFSKFQVNS